MQVEIMPIMSPMGMGDTGARCQSHCARRSPCQLHRALNSASCAATSRHPFTPYSHPPILSISSSPVSPSIHRVIKLSPPLPAPSLSLLWMCNDEWVSDRGRLRGGCGTVIAYHSVKRGAGALTVRRCAVAADTAGEVAFLCICSTC